MKYDSLDAVGRSSVYKCVKTAAAYSSLKSRLMAGATAKRVSTRTVQNGTVGKWRVPELGDTYKPFAAVIDSA